MALIDQISERKLEANAKHSVVECTYSVVTEENGEKLLQIDTYGSSKRKLYGKKSQSIRFTRKALNRLKAILTENGL